MGLEAVRHIFSLHRHKETEPDTRPSGSRTALTPQQIGTRTKEVHIVVPRIAAHILDGIDPHEPFYLEGFFHRILDNGIRNVSIETQGSSRKIPFYDVPIKGTHKRESDLSDNNFLAGKGILLTDPGVQIFVKRAMSGPLPKGQIHRVGIILAKELLGERRTYDVEELLHVAGKCGLSPCMDDIGPRLIMTEKNIKGDGVIYAVSSLTHDRGVRFLTLSAFDKSNHLRKMHGYVHPSIQPSDGLAFSLGAVRA
jgi:hypothetical protein